MQFRGGSLVGLALAETLPARGVRATFEGRQQTKIIYDDFDRQQGRIWLYDDFNRNNPSSYTDNSGIGSYYQAFSRTGAAGTANFTITTEQLNISGTTPTVIRDFGSLMVEPHIEAQLGDIATPTAANRHIFYVRYVDANNYVAWIPGATQFRTVVAGTVTNTTTNHGALTYATNQFFRVHIDATGTARCYQNNVLRHTQVNVTEHAGTATKMGVGGDTTGQTLYFHEMVLQRNGANDPQLTPGISTSGHQWESMNSLSTFVANQVSVFNGEMRGDQPAALINVEALFGFYIPAYEVDIEVEFQPEHISSGTVGIIFKMDSSGQNGYLLNIGNATGQFFRKTNNAYTALGGTFTTQSASRMPVRVRVLLQGTTMYCYINGIFRGSTSDSTYMRPGHAGIRIVAQPESIGGTRVSYFHAMYLAEPMLQEDVGPTEHYRPIEPRRTTGATPVPWSTWPRRPALTPADGAAYDALVLADNPLGYWKFGESTAPVTTTLLSDTFDRANSTTVVGSPQVGNNPVILVGTWGIIGNQLYQATATAEGCLVWEIGINAVTAGYDFTHTIGAVAGTSDPGPIVRAIDNNNFILCQTVFGGGVSAIFQRVGGTYTRISPEVSVPWTTGDVVRVNVTPEAITLYRNGVQVNQAVTRVFFQATRVGFRVNAITTPRFDTVSVTAMVPQGYYRMLDSSGLASPTQYFDDFNRANSTTGMGTSSSGHTWVDLAGTWGIIDNQAYLVTPAGDGQSSSVIETTFADGVLQVQFTSNGTGGITTTTSGAGSSVVFRAVDNNNYWILETAGGNAAWTLFTRSAGTFTAQFNSAVLPPISPGDIVTIILSGTNIQVRRNGYHVFNVNSTIHQNATRHGIRLFRDATTGAAGSRWDNWSFTPTGSRHGIYGSSMVIDSPGPTPSSKAVVLNPFMNSHPRQGVGQQIEIPNNAMWSPHITGDMTLEAWVYLDMYAHLVDQRQVIFAKGGPATVPAGGATAYEYEFEMHTYGRMNFGIFTAAGAQFMDCVSDYGEIQPGRWHHVAAVYKRNNYAAIFVDGRRVGTTTVFNNVAIAAGNRSLQLGSRVPDNLYFPGRISQAAFYNTALTDERIAIHAGAPAPDATTNTVTGLLASHAKEGQATNVGNVGGTFGVNSQFVNAPQYFYNPSSNTHVSTSVTSIDFQLQSLGTSTQIRVGIATAFTTIADTANIPWLALDNAQPAYVDLTQASLTANNSSTVDTWNNAILGAPLTLLAGQAYSLVIVSTAKSGTSVPLVASNGQQKNILFPPTATYFGTNATSILSGPVGSPLLFRLNGTRVEKVRPVGTRDRKVARKLAISSGSDTHLSDMRWINYHPGATPLPPDDVTYRTYYAGVDGHYQALVFQGLDDNNFAWLEINNSTGLLRTMIAGVVTNLGGSVNLAAIPDTFTTYRVVVAGGNVLVYRNGNLEHTETAPTLPGGTFVGIGTESLNDRFEEITGPLSYGATPTLQTQYRSPISTRYDAPVGVRTARYTYVPQNTFKVIMGGAYLRGYHAIPRRERQTDDPTFLETRTTYPRRP